MIEIILIGLVITISFILSIAIGGGSTGSTPFAPAVGAKSISTLRAALLIGLVTFLGAVLQGQNVAETIGSDLVNNVALQPIELSVVLLIGSIFMFIGIRYKYPIATAFTFTSAFIGAGLAAGGTPVYDLYLKIGFFWLFTPIIAIIMSYSIIKSLLYYNKSNKEIITILLTLIVFIVFNIEFNIPYTDYTSLTNNIQSMGVPDYYSILIVFLFSLTIGMIIYIRTENTDNLINNILIFLGFIVGFSAGASQVGIAVGALIPITNSTSIPYASIFYLGGFGLLIGAWAIAPKMIQSVSQEYASLGPRRSISALFSAFIIAQLAVNLGYPISFNQVMISSIIGSSMAVKKGDESVSSDKIKNTVYIWIITIIVSYILSYLTIYYII